MGVQDESILEMLTRQIDNKKDSLRRQDEIKTLESFQKSVVLKAELNLLIQIKDDIIYGGYHKI